MIHCTIFCLVISDVAHMGSVSARSSQPSFYENNPLKHEVNSFSRANMLYVQPNITLLFIVESPFIKIHYLLTISVLKSRRGTNTKGWYFSSATIIPAVNVTKKRCNRPGSAGLRDNKRDCWVMKFKLAELIIAALFSIFWIPYIPGYCTTEFMALLLGQQTTPPL